MDFLDVLKNKLQSLSFTPPVIDIGSYRTNANSIAIRPTPGSIDTRFLDKGKVYPYPFQILAHHKDNFAANSIVHQIMDELDNKEGGYITSGNGSFILISIVTYNTPSHVEVTDYGNLWTVLFTAELYIKGDE